jgi:hypothetical protein
MLGREEDFQKSSYLLEDAVRPLPLPSGRTMQRGNQERNMSVIAGLTENACAAALRVGMSAEDAISILELGTGIIMST